MSEHVGIVANFARDMHDRLVDNKHKDEYGWKELSNSYLMDKIHFHTRLVGLHMKQGQRRGESAIDFKKKVKTEAIDAANYLMMLVDNLGEENEE